MEDVSRNRKDTDTSTASISDGLVDMTLDRIEPNRYHFWVLAVCGMVWAIDNMIIAEIPFMICEVTPVYGKLVTSVLAGVLFFGMALGASGWGVVSDWLGRKTATVLSLVTACIGSLLSGLSFNSAYCVGPLLFITGLGVGGNVPVAGCLYGEFFPQTHRSKYMVVLTTIWSIGNIMGAVVCYVMFGQNVAHAPRIVAASIVPFTLIAIPLVQCTLDESPRWLAKNGRQEQAMKIVEKMSKYRASDQTMLVSLLADEDSKDTESAPPQPDADGLPNGKNPDQMPLYAKLRLLFSKELWFKTTALTFVWFAFALAYAMFLLWLPTILGEQSGGTKETSDEPDCSLLAGVAAAFATIPGYAFAFGFLALLGPKYMTFITLSVAVVAEVAFEVLKDTLPDKLYWAKIGLSVVYAMLTTAGWAGLYAITADGFPTVVRNTAFGLCSAMNRVGAVIAPVLGGVLPTWVPIVALAISAMVLALVPMHTGEELESIAGREGARNDLDESTLEGTEVTVESRQKEM